jgi:spore coat polysaccharide biosynthesis protein SpsF (cytidylyltransferase family)
LLAAAAEAHDAADREHVTPYIRARPERFPAQGVWLSPPHPDIRLTLDTRDDLAALRALIADIGPSAELPQILRAVGIVEYRLVDRPT